MPQDLQETPALLKQQLEVRSGTLGHPKGTRCLSLDRGIKPLFSADNEACCQGPVQIPLNPGGLAAWAQDWLRCGAAVWP